MTPDDMDGSFIRWRLAVLVSWVLQPERHLSFQKDWMENIPV